MCSRRPRFLLPSSIRSTSLSISSRSIIVSVTAIDQLVSSARADGNEDVAPIRLFGLRLQPIVTGQYHVALEPIPTDRTQAIPTRSKICELRESCV